MATIQSEPSQAQLVTADQAAQFRQEQAQQQTAFFASTFLLAMAAASQQQGSKKGKDQAQDASVTTGSTVPVPPPVDDQTLDVTSPAMQQTLGSRATLMSELRAHAEKQNPGLREDQNLSPQTVRKDSKSGQVKFEPVSAEDAVKKLQESKDLTRATREAVEEENLRHKKETEDKSPITNIGKGTAEIVIGLMLVPFTFGLSLLLVGKGVYDVGKGMGEGAEVAAEYVEHKENLNNIRGTAKDSDPFKDRHSKTADDLAVANPEQVLQSKKEQEAEKRADGVAAGRSGLKDEEIKDGKVRASEDEMHASKMGVRPITTDVTARKSWYEKLQGLIGTEPGVSNPMERREWNKHADSIAEIAHLQRDGVLTTPGTDGIKDGVTDTEALAARQGHSRPGSKLHPQQHERWGREVQDAAKRTEMDAPNVDQVAQVARLQSNGGVTVPSEEQIRGGNEQERAAHLKMLAKGVNVRSDVRDANTQESSRTGDGTRGVVATSAAKHQQQQTEAQQQQ